MKLVEFQYTKRSGEISQRAVIEVVSPRPHFEGIDVSDMPEAEFAVFVNAYRELQTQQQLQTHKLLQEFDLTHNYRRFVPEGMSNVIAEHI